MATTVKISKQTSRKLDELQARKRLQTGKRVTKQSILEDIVERAYGGREALILLKGPEYPLPPKVRRMIRSLPSDWGVKTREEDIDRLLYGEAE